MDEVEPTIDEIRERWGPVLDGPIVCSQFISCEKCGPLQAICKVCGYGSDHPDSCEHSGPHFEALIHAVRDMRRLLELVSQLPEAISPATEWSVFCEKCNTRCKARQLPSGAILADESCRCPRA